MKQKRNSLRQLLWIFVVTILIASFHACDDDDIRRVVSLQYMEIGDIGTGMTFEARPYTRGNLTDFTISQVKFNGEVKEVSGFAINAESGVITLVHNNTLEPGLYTLTVSCKVNGIPETFQDVLTVNLLAPAPQVFKYKSPLITFEYGYRDTAYVSEISESVTIQKFILSKEGDSPYFQIDGTTGTITLNPNNKFDEPWPGHYKPTVGIVTPAGTQYYPGIVEFNITSAPLKLNYEVPVKETEKGYSDTSAMPIYMGSPDQLVYAIKSAVSGEKTTDKLHITADGRIYVDKDNETMEQGEYQIALTITNQYGTKDFDHVFTWKIVNYITPIENFTYPETNANRLKAFNIAVADDFKGDGVTFSFANTLPAALSDLTINSTTGEISAPQGHKIPIGDYPINIKAINSKAPEGVTTILTLHITEHPNYFTLSYGNNLGLTPVENYASQYSFAKDDGNTAAIETTIPVVTTYSGITYQIASRYSSAKHSIVNDDYFFAEINSSTGELHIKAKGQGAGAIHHLIIEATKGTGEDAYKVKIPVFIQSRPDNSEPTTYTYQPFVLKVNPKTGGVSGNPVFNSKLAAAHEANNLKIDFNKNQLVYFDFREDFQDLSSVYPGSGNEMYSQSKLLNYLWDQYKKRAGSLTGHQPISNTEGNDFSTNKGFKLCYIDPTDFKVYVNPEIWKDENGNYANGMFWCKAVYKGGASGNSYAIVLWFDPEF